MAEYPTTFCDEEKRISVWYPDRDIASTHAYPFFSLRNSGLVVVAGLRPERVADLTEIAEQVGTREYCANDIKTRWTDITTAEKQLAKDGGRAVFRLERLEDGKTMGFGWTGKSSDEEREYLPDCENTFAIRMHEASQGQGLAVPFTKAIVFGSMALYGARKIGLETWGSNTAAVRTYRRAGAELVTTKDDIRPTLHEDEYTFLVDGVPHRRDVRLYMQFPQTFPENIPSIDFIKGAYYDGGRKIFS